MPKAVCGLTEENVTNESLVGTDPVMSLSRCTGTPQSVTGVGVGRADCARGRISPHQIPLILGVYVQTRGERGAAGHSVPCPSTHLGVPSRS